MKRKSSKYLEFYLKCMKTGRMPCAGLCNAFGFKYLVTSNPLLELFKPGSNDLALIDSGNIICWGYDSNPYHSQKRRFYSFTPLRQTIVLLMHEMETNPIEE